MFDIGEISLEEKLFSRPLTRTGSWAVGMAIGFVVLLVLTILWGSRPGNPRAGFWADPLGAFLVISTALSGIGGGVASAIGILFWRERSLLLFLILLVGAFVLYFTLGELSEGLSRVRKL